MSVKSKRTFIYFAVMALLAGGLFALLPGLNYAAIRGDVLTWLKLSPTNGSIVGNSVTIIGSIGREKYTIAVNGTSAYVYVNDHGDFTCRLYLSKGVHTNTIVLTDRHGRETTASFWYIVSNRPPDLGGLTNISVGRGQPVTLIAQVNDPDGDSMTYVWRQVSGPANAVLPVTNEPSLKFAAPQTPGDYMFRATVSDGSAAVSTDFKVSVVNQPPAILSVASGGRLQVGTTGSLNVKASDPDGDKLVYSWKQTGGPETVTIQNANSSNASFIAPSTKGDYTFTATVSDGSDIVRSQAISFDVGAYIVFVAEGGTGNGLSVAAPLGRLDRAFALAQTNGVMEIRISGNPKVGMTPTLSNVSGVSITGGWNGNFTKQAEASVLDGQYLSKNIMLFKACEHLNVSNVVITGASERGLVFQSGGTRKVKRLYSDGYAFYDDVPITCNFCTIFADVINNHGGGIYLNGDNNTFTGNVIGNKTSYDNGAGIRLAGNRNTFNGTVSKNIIMTTNGYFGGYYFFGSGSGGGLYTSGDSNTFNLNISGNTSGGGGSSQGYYTYGGGGGICIQGEWNVFNGNITGNTVNGHGRNCSMGGGVYLNGSHNVFNSNISGNSISGGNTDVLGGGVYIGGIKAGDMAGSSPADNNIFNGNITGNSVQGFGGGVYVAGNENQFLMKKLSGNNAVYGGGVACIGSKNVFKCSITANKASQNGGGVYNGSGNDFVDATITGNTPDNIYTPR